VLGAAVRPSRAGGGAVGRHRHRAGAGAGRGVPVGGGVERPAVPGRGAGAGAAGVPADHRRHRRRGHGGRRGERRDAALSAGPPGGPAAAARREAGVGGGVRAARGAVRDADQLRRRRGRVRIRRRRRRRRGGRGDVAVGGGAHPRRAGAAHGVHGRLPRAVHARPRSDRAVLLHAHRLTARRGAGGTRTRRDQRGAAAARRRRGRALLPPDHPLAGLDRPVPRPDPLDRRPRGRGGAGGLRPGGLRRGLGELRHQGHHQPRTSPAEDITSRGHHQPSLTPRPRTAAPRTRSARRAVGRTAPPAPAR